MKRIETGNECGRSGKTWKRSVGLFCVGCFMLLLVFSSGCGNKFFDPTQTGRFRATTSVMPILDSLGVAEETPVAWEQGEEPRPTDTMFIESDYVFMSGDIVRVSIFELLQEGVEFVNEYVVTETGKLSIPEVGVVQAAGLTETQLEEEIRQILSPSILREPSVVVILAASQQRTFSVLGNGIPGAGRYIIPRYGFRLADAVAMAGGPSQWNVSYIYVSRFESGYRGGPGLVEPDLNLQPVGPGEGGRERLEILTPRARHEGRVWPESSVVIASSEMGTARELGGVTFSDSARVSGAGGSGWGSVTRTGGGSVRGQEGEPISVKEILKSLAVRSRQEGSAAGGGQSGDMLVSPGVRTSSRPVGTRTSERQTDLSGIMSGLSSRPSSGSMESRPGGYSRGLRQDVSPGGSGMDGKVSVDDLLRAISEPSEPESTNRQADMQEVLRSLSDPGGPGGTRDLKGIEETLRTMTEPERVGNGSEQRLLDDVEILSLSKPDELERVENGEDEAGRIEWIFQDGKWIPVKIGDRKPMQPVIKVEPGNGLVTPIDRRIPTELEAPSGPRARLIRIPTDKLLAGDPRYNIVIKPGDTIHVPVDVIGEFCITGNVNNQGYINITGRPMTLKQAIAAAGGLGPLAWPKRVEVVRRIERKKEEIVLVDLDKIASGEQPDFFIKPHDLINVGSHATAPWRFILRNAFRATYGFGFIYDRNFADRDFGNSPLPF
ncbi:MAG: polysaccharide biosynthesis/export family protein [Phycisphaerales bacterium]|nr:MAG: polysaccharide biosynthesis/export family protein [Phycisphaerales bacterium]